MFTKRLPTPPPSDPSALAEAALAKAASLVEYQESVEKATVAIQQGNRMRQIRIVNNIGPAFGAVYERRRSA